MGLDSVELIIEIEKYFSISIPDTRAEKILCINDFVNLIFGNKTSDIEDNEFKKSILDKINSTLFEMNLEMRELIILEDKLEILLQKLTKENYNIFQNKMNLELPFDFSKGIFSRLFKTVNKKENFSNKTISDFIDALLIFNYKNKIISIRKLTRYIIFIIIGGILSDTLGIDPIEIEPEKQFVRDYGIDK